MKMLLAMSLTVVLSLARAADLSHPAVVQPQPTEGNMAHLDLERQSFPHNIGIEPRSVYTSQVDEFRYMINEEISKVIPAVSQRLGHSIQDMKEEIKGDLNSIMSYLDGSIVVESDAVGDSERVKGGRSEIHTTRRIRPNKQVEISPLSLEILGSTISTAMEAKVENLIEVSLWERLQNLTQEQTNKITKTLEEMDENYSRMYKKLFYYTRNQLTILNSRIDTFNGNPETTSTTTPTTPTRSITSTITGQTTTIDNTTLQMDYNITVQTLPRDCGEANVMGHPTGVTTIMIDPEDSAKQDVWCDQDTLGGGWTVILARLPVENGTHIDFRREYTEYEKGFGDPASEYWLGLENIHKLTNMEGDNVLRVEIANTGEKAFARYSNFRVEDKASGYRLQVSEYSKDSTAGDSLEYHSGMKFSTFNKDKDEAEGGSCSSWSGGGGWWYNFCYYSNPTGIYPPNDLPQDTEADHFIEWRKWQGFYSYLTYVVFKVRPQYYI